MIIHMALTEVFISINSDYLCILNQANLFD